VEKKHSPTLIGAKTLGRFARSYDAVGYEFVLSRYATRSRLPLHEHSAAYLCINFGAPFLESSSGSCEREIPSFAVVAHPEGEAHSNVFAAEGGLCLSVFFRSHDAQFWRLATADKSVSVDTEIIDVARRFSRLLNEYAPFESLTALSFSELTLELIEHVAHANSGRPTHLIGIQRALDAIREEPERSWALTELASIAELHPTHLARQMRRATGYTCGEHIRRLRTLAAARLLASEQNCIADVAATCGFADQAHMTRTLRAYFGVTPRTLRKTR
jgi:AraC family transcriptional regulator